MAPDPRHTPSKGRPTPKRRVAQGRRAGPLPPPPRTRKEAYRRLRDQNVTSRSKAREAMRSGDTRYLPNRDQGPARALVRDIVDARRNVGSVFLFVAVLVLVGFFVPDARIKGAATIVWTIVFVAIILDSIGLGFRIKKLANERFPDRKERTGTLIWYGVTRATMIRRWRMPKPRVRTGEAV